MATPWQSLRAECGKILIEGMPRGLREAIDAALKAGSTRAEVMRRVRKTAGRRGLTVLAVEAYLAAVKAK
jgi:hypothetical protein